ncbi:MAG: 2-dehydro-3-deoxy-D-gluconate 5-dehydrogenase KduD [Sphingobacteriales bacterium]|nr:2-dehydro-3-deoxy-D-gluconate 5-dehydrogenase KduD [Sphingobacteriales bacterium]OJY84666.1 MAG: 2-deoxy-D-gluconate 3-dehydrogenase [Sphingobacteriales bacterium 44-15]
MNKFTLFDLSGKTALVTGCNKGIGKAMATGLAEAGADIIGISSSMPSSGSDIEREVKALGRNFAAYKADLSDRKKLYATIERILAAYSTIDILVNNAGIIKRAPAAEHSDDFWDEVLNINLSAQFVLSREIGKHMLQRGSGKIIFTCSLLSFQGGINVPGYTASKSALAGLVRALGNEWGSKGVQVNGIAPGYIATDNTQALREDVQRNKSILERIPAGHWGAPEDFKGPAVFLASAASAYVNGTILFVDGGWMAR